MVCAPVRRDNPPSFSGGIIDRTSAQTMLYLTCTMISSVDLAHYGVSRTKEWVPVNCGTRIQRTSLYPLDGLCIKQKFLRNSPFDLVLAHKRFHSILGPRL